MNPYIWISTIVAFSVFQAYASSKSSGSTAWFFILWISTTIPMWPIISRYSKNLMWDVMAYDTAVFLTWAFATALITGEWRDYGLNQWLGIIFIIAGFSLFQRVIK